MALPGWVRAREDADVELLTAAVAAATLFLLYLATHRRGWVLALGAGWSVLQAAIALTGFYTDTTSLPPRLLLAVGPAAIAVAGLFFTARGRAFADDASLSHLTFLHVVRLPVELVLLMLFAGGLIPQIMTLEGRNYDVLTGITAPVAAYVGVVKGRLSTPVLVAWNVAGLFLLATIVFYGVFSVPGPLQRYGLEQPNVAIARFPYVWIASTVIPIALFCHLAALRQLLRRQGPITTSAES